MNRKTLILGTAILLSAVALSACTGEDSGESSVSGTNKPGATAPAVTGVGEALVVDDFTVKVDSAGQSDIAQSGLQSGDPGYVPPTFWMSYTVTYIGTGPMVKWKVPWPAEEVFVPPESNDPWIVWDETPVTTGEVFTYKVAVEANLAKEAHTFYVVGWDEASEQYVTLGTITLGPADLS